MAEVTSRNVWVGSALIAFSFIAGAAFGYYVLNPGATVRSVFFKHPDKPRGFLCKCERGSGGETVEWKGRKNTQCRSGRPHLPIDPNGKKINGTVITGITVPEGACCKRGPNIDGTAQYTGSSCP